jgi:isopentenyl-diphosphate delta-isomerase
MLLAKNPCDSLRALIREGDTVAPNLGMIVAVVDDRNRVISRAERAALFARRLNFRTVHVLLLDILGRLLLQRLAPDHLRSPNLLGSSVAGYVTANETYFRAARRKLREELGVTARIRGIGQVNMNDQGSRKFVGVFTGTLHQRPIIKDDQIAELVYKELREVDRMVRRSPRAFTPTFLLIYDHFRRQQEPRELS